MSTLPSGEACADICRDSRSLNDPPGWWLQPNCSATPGASRWALSGRGAQPGRGGGTARAGREVFATEAAAQRYGALLSGLAVHAGDRAGDEGVVRDGDSVRVSSRCAGCRDPTSTRRWPEHPTLVAVAVDLSEPG